MSGTIVVSRLMASSASSLLYMKQNTQGTHSHIILQVLSQSVFFSSPFSFLIFFKHTRSKVFMVCRGRIGRRVSLFPEAASSIPSLLKEEFFHSNIISPRELEAYFLT